jgi:DNA-binding NtrC family response regulator
MNSSAAIQPLLPPNKKTGRDRPYVLFIEDDSDLRETVTTVLEYMDYDVAQCSSVAQAAAAVSATKRVDLIVSDICGCGGPVCESIAKICVRAPEAVVLFASGYSQERCSSFLECGKSCPIGFLPKPFSVHEFQQAIQSTLLRKPVASRCTKKPVQSAAS